jgi:hypothetical protein
MPGHPIASEKGDLHNCYYCSEVVHTACVILDEETDPFKLLHICRTCSPGSAGSGNEDDGNDRKRAAVPRTPSPPPDLNYWTRDTVLEREFGPEGAATGSLPDTMWIYPNADKINFELQQPYTTTDDPRVVVVVVIVQCVSPMVPYREN